MGLSLANKITITRIALVPVFITTVLYYEPSKDYLRFLALAIFLFSALSDLVDGYIAKTRHQKTRAGAILDPLADKILIISAFLSLYSIGWFFPDLRFPLWLVIAVITRDAFLIAGSGLIYLIKGELTIVPKGSGKAAVLFESLCIIGFFLQLSFSKIFWYAALVLSILSLIQYAYLAVQTINNSGKNL